MNMPNDLIISDNFFSREKELFFLQKKVQNLKNGYRHNVALLGKRLSGKSSLLLHFLSTLNEGDVIPIYLNLSALTFPALIDQFIGMLLFDTCKKENQDTANDLESLIESASLKLPQTFKKIKTVYSLKSANKERAAFEQLLDLPACFSKESGKFCVIVLDDYRKFTNYNLREPFSVLGKKIMLQKMCLYILSDYPDTNSANILSEQLSLLFGKFQTMELGPFNYFESQNFIDNNIKDVNLSAELKQFLIYFSGGEPFYLDLMTKWISSKALEKKSLVLSQKDLAIIVCKSLCTKNSPLNQYFLRISEKLSEAAETIKSIKILNSVICNNKLSEIIKSCNYNKDIVNKILDKAIALDMVQKNGPLYSINDEVLKLWLRLKNNETFPMFNLDRAQCFKKGVNELMQCIESFINQKQKSIDHKILNLIAAFDNEKVTVGKATHILPAFKHIRTENLAQEDILLSAHGSKLWTFSVFKKVVDEDKIVDFISRCKSKKHKVSRKVLIALAGITPEAKLLALQEKIWIWPLEKLNDVLGLYRKPGISIL